MATPTQIRRRGRWSLILGCLVAAVAFAAVAYASSVDTAVVDTDAPTGSVSLGAGASAPIDIKLTVTGRQDNAATLKIYKTWTLDGGVFTGSDEETVNVAARAASDPASLYTVSGTVKVAASQPTGGPFTLAIKPHSVTTTAPAALSLGNASNYQVTVTAPPTPSDSTPPSIGYVLSPASPDGNNGWYKSDVTLAWTVIENESPSSLVETGCVDQNINADQASTNYSCSATSDGGSAGPETVSIKRDATKPTISGSASPAPNGAGWNKTNVTVSYSCDDNLSGVASCGPDETLTADGAGQSSTGTAVDNAGNSDTATVSGINIDKTAPVVAVTGVANGATYTLGSEPAAGCSTTDPLSGVAAVATLTSSGGPIGSITATCSGALDNAGNSGSASATYVVVYAFNGFFQPVDNTPTCNKVKAGSAIPVKFSLGGYQGMDILAAGSPTSGAGTCDSNDVSAVDETLTAGNSSLNYDGSADQYIYVWKTDKSWAGSARWLVVKLADGTEHRARFTFTK